MARRAVKGEYSALWKRISAVGLAAMDRTRAGDAYKQLKGAWGHALIAGNISTEMIRELCQHVDDLERRLTESPIKYRGIWTPGTYSAGSLTTHSGSMWFAEKATDLKPGEGGGWVLCVKRGADAKERG